MDREHGGRPWTTNAALAFAGDIAAKSSSLVIMVAAGRVLSVADFAALATALAYAFFLVPVLDGGAQMLIARDGARDRGDRGALFVASVLGRSPLAVVGVLGCALAGIASGRPGLWLGTCLLIVANSLSMSLGGVLRATQNFLPEMFFKLTYAMLTAGSAIVAALVWETADSVLLALGASAWLAQIPMWIAVRRRATFGSRLRILHVLRTALPLGLLTMMAAAYGRSGTIALSELSSDIHTSIFAVASTLAFGLLSVAQAVVGALLPRLASEADETERLRVMRGAFRVMVAGSVVGALAMAALGPIAIGLLFGSRYDAASVPFAILCAALPLIVANSVLGTCLLATGHVRPVVTQTTVTLAANIAALFLLVPWIDAEGAALATVLCELAGLVVLCSAVRRRLPDLSLIGPALVGCAVQPAGGAGTRLTTGR